MRNPLSLKIKKQLNILEKELVKAVDGASSNIENGYVETIKAGGKRLRPALVFICSQVGNDFNGNVKKAAMSCELIHVASLVHDDIMDGAKIRRGRPTVYSKFGDQIALRIGDYLFAKSFLLLNETGNLEAVSILASAVKQLSEGEIEQIQSAFSFDQSPEFYYQKIRHKTASLFRAAAELGTIFGNGTKFQVKALGDYAQNLGMAFQIYDDILDIEADEKVLGKSLGTDLRDGTLTLPIYFALKESKDGRLAAIFTEKKCSDRDIKEALDIITSTQAIDKARNEAKRFINKALLSIGKIDNERLKKQLKAICEYTIERYN